MIILVLEKIYTLNKKEGREVSTHVMFKLHAVVPEHHLDRKTTGKEQRFSFLFGFINEGRRMHILPGESQRPSSPSLRLLVTSARQLLLIQ
jgi:hypothetical protein